MKVVIYEEFITSLNIILSSRHWMCLLVRFLRVCSYHTSAYERSYLTPEMLITDDILYFPPSSPFQESGTQSVRELSSCLQLNDLLDVNQHGDKATHPLEMVILSVTEDLHEARTDRTLCLPSAVSLTSLLPPTLWLTRFSFSLPPAWRLKVTLSSSHIYRIALTSNSITS